MTFTITTAIKSDKKDILRFYKQQHYSARFLGFDQAYFIKKNELIIACVIVSTITKNNPNAFLHALVTDKNFTGQKLASHLLQHCIRQHPSLVCFANKSLTPLYINNNFTLLNFSELSTELAQRFNVYSTKDKQLQSFISQ